MNNEKKLNGSDDAVKLFLTAIEKSF